MQIYLIPTCNTCRRALSALRKAGHDPVVVDLRKDGVSHDTVARFHGLFGDDLINRRSRTWRGLGDEARARDPVALVTSCPLVMKRPVIETEDEVFLGWSAETQAALG